MKFKEFVNLIDDKIDYLFRRGKNADERCYDYFIRTVTFFVVVLIVLCYASFVHAETPVDTNDYDVMNQEYFFTYTGLNEHYEDSSAINVYPEINQGFLSNYPPLWTENRIQNFQSTLSGMDLKNDSSIITEEYKKYYALFLQIDTGTTDGICRCNLISIYAKDIPLIINDGLTVFNSGLANWYIYSEYPYVINNLDFQVNYVNQYLPFQLKGNTSTEVQDGGLHAVNGNVTGYLFGCDCNIYSLMYSNVYTGSTSSTRTYDSIQGMVNAIYDDSVIDKPFNLNPKANIINPEEPEEPEAESNSNHMYLKYINASFYGSNNLADSNFVVSARWDDWIEQHINDYECDIYYEIYYDGEPWKREVDGELVGEAIYGDYLDTVPLGVLSGGYTTEFRTIANKMDINNESLNSMIDNLQKSNMIIGTSNPVMNVEQALNGASSEFSIKTTEVNIGSLYSFFHRLDDLTTQHAGETVVYVGSFHLDVTINIHDKNDRDIESGNFSRRWDFANGTSSTIYDIYNNGNPWEGSTSEGTAISGQGGGSSINNSNIAYGGQGGNSSSIGNSNTVNVYGNGYQDTELHQLTKEDIEENHINIIRTIESLRDVFERFAEVKNEKQSFLQMIFTEFYEIPGVAYMVLSLIVVFSVMVIIFIIKIAF